VLQVWNGDGTSKVTSPATWQAYGGFISRPEPWPTQDLNLPDTAVGAWGIDVLVGEAPPAAVLLAAEAVACQIVRWCQGAPCDVPDNAISVSREGVTIQLARGLKAVSEVAAVLDVDWCLGRPARFISFHDQARYATR
jgi:hypothetical protein